MPRVDNQLNSEYWQPVATGPIAQADLSNSVGVPATVAISGNYLSPVILSDGFKVLALGVTSSQAGAINVQRYLDFAGTIAMAAVDTAALAAATPQVLLITDGKPFASFTVQITNTSGTTIANITKFVCLLNAQ